MEVRGVKKIASLGGRQTAVAPPPDQAWAVSPVALWRRQTSTLGKQPRTEQAQGRLEGTTAQGWWRIALWRGEGVQQMGAAAQGCSTGERSPSCPLEANLGWLCRLPKVSFFITPLPMVPRNSSASAPADKAEQGQHDLPGERRRGAPAPLLQRSPAPGQGGSRDREPGIVQHQVRVGGSQCLGGTHAER